MPRHNRKTSSKKPSSSRIQARSSAQPVKDRMPEFEPVMKLFNRNWFEIFRHKSTEKPKKELFIKVCNFHHNSFKYGEAFNPITDRLTMMEFIKKEAMTITDTPVEFVNYDPKSLSDAELEKYVDYYKQCADFAEQRNPQVLSTPQYDVSVKIPEPEELARMEANIFEFFNDPKYIKNAPFINQDNSSPYDSLMILKFWEKYGNDKGLGECLTHLYQAYKYVVFQKRQSTEEEKKTCILFGEDMAKMIPRLPGYVRYITGDKYKEWDDTQLSIAYLDYISVKIVILNLNFYKASCKINNNLQNHEMQKQYIAARVEYGQFHIDEDIPRETVTGLENLSAYTAVLTNIIKGNTFDGDAYDVTYCDMVNYAVIENLKEYEAYFLKVANQHKTLLKAALNLEKFMNVLKHMKLHAKYQEEYGLVTGRLLTSLSGIMKNNSQGTLPSPVKEQKTLEASSVSNAEPNEPKKLFSDIFLQEITHLNNLSSQLRNTDNPLEKNRLQEEFNSAYREADCHLLQSTICLLPEFDDAENFTLEQRQIDFYLQVYNDWEQLDEIQEADLSIFERKPELIFSVMRIMANTAKDCPPPILTPVSPVTIDYLLENAGKILLTAIASKKELIMDALWAGFDLGNSEEYVRLLQEFNCMPVVNQEMDYCLKHPIYHAFLSEFLNILRDLQPVQIFDTTFDAPQGDSVNLSKYGIFAKADRSAESKLPPVSSVVKAST